MRRTIHSGWVSSKPSLAQLVRADVLDVPGGRVEPQPALAVDVGDRSGHSRSNTSGWPSGTGIITLSRLTTPLPMRPSVAYLRLLSAPAANHANTPCRICQPQCAECNSANRSSQRGRLSEVSKTFVGSRVRQLRSERGFSQAALAQMLEISPSYLNQIEHDVRPLTVAVLLRITEVFGVDATFFASQDDTRLVAELREVTMDRDLDIDVDPPEVAEMVSAHPALARAMVNLHRRYRITTAQLAAATEERFSDGSGSGSITMPHEEVRDYFYQRQNYLHELDTAAEDLTIRMRMHRGDLAARADPTGSPRCTGSTSSGASTSATPCCTAIDPGTKTLEISNHLSSGPAGLQDGRRTGLPGVRRPDRQHGRPRASSPATSRAPWPGWDWPTTSPRPRCCPTANSTTSPRISATTSSGCRRSTR